MTSKNMATGKQKKAFIEKWIQSFSSEMERISIIRDTFIHSELSEISTIYHYTSSKALLKILSRKELWLTGALFQNDEDEIQYFIKLFKSNLEEKLNSEKEIIEKYKILDYFDEEIGDIISKFKKIIYSFSTSEEKDSHLMWSMYTNNDGYAIEMNLEILIQTLATLIPNERIKPETVIYSSGIQYGRIIYNPKTIQKIINKIIEHLFSFLSRSLEQDKKYGYIRLFMKQYLFHICYFALFTKNDKFYAEKEFRIIAYCNPNNLSEFVRFRNKNGLIIPYLSLTLNDDRFYSCIKSIMTGPCKDKTLQADSLSFFLECHGISSISVEMTTSSLR